MGWGAPSVDRDQQLAVGPPLAQVPQRVRDLAEREPPVDDRHDGARVTELRDGNEILHVGLNHQQADLLSAVRPISGPTRSPIVSTRPAMSDPKILKRGRTGPPMRAYSGLPRRNSQSDALTETECTLIRTWPSPGRGRSTSSSRNTSADPYRSYTTAFMTRQYRLRRPRGWPLIGDHLT
jgi:hypothetical protein